jgi:hypothetical protein
MKRTRRYAWLAVFALLAAGVAWRLPHWLALRDGVQAYLYGYPLVTMDLTRQVMTAPQPPGAAAGRPGAGPVNRLAHVAEFPDHSFRDVVAPNADTLYSIAWLDLAAEPMVLSVPDMQGRWVLFELLDAWTNAHASLGTRRYGGAARRYLISGPGWQGRVPEGMEHITSPTRIGWIIGRTYTRNAADFEAVHRVQAQYHLTPLSRWSAVDDTPSPIAPPSAAIDLRTPVVTQVAQLDTRRFYERLAELMRDNPPAAADAPMLARLARIGLRPGEPLRWEELDATTREGLEAGAWFAHGLFHERAPGTQGPVEATAVQRGLFRALSWLIDRTMLNRHNGWTVPLNLGVYDTRYAQRALVTLLGLGANGPEDAVYPMTTVDDSGHALDGAKPHVLHFAADAVPPAQAFWSLTMYDTQGFFVDNPIRRYAIGDRDALKFNADGSLDLWVQHEAPSPEKSSNWLPAPAGPFKLALRLYDPRPAVLEGRWVPPAVTAALP